MKHYEVELKFSGHVFIYVTAVDEESAVEKALVEFESTNDNFYDSIDAYPEELRD